MLTDYDADWEAGGIRYSKPEWNFFERDKAAKPVSHSMSKAIDLELTVRKNTWDEAPPLPVELVDPAKVKAATCLRNLSSGRAAAWS